MAARTAQTPPVVETHEALRHAMTGVPPLEEVVLAFLATLPLPQHQGTLEDRLRLAADDIRALKTEQDQQSATLAASLQDRNRLREAAGVLRADLAWLVRECENTCPNSMPKTQAFQQAQAHLGSGLGVQ